MINRQETKRGGLFGEIQSDWMVKKKGKKENKNSLVFQNWPIGDLAAVDDFMEAVLSLWRLLKLAVLVLLMLATIAKEWLICANKTTGGCTLGSAEEPRRWVVAGRGLLRAS